MYYHETDAAYIRRLEATIDALRDENERLQAEANRYLDNWVAAQDLAAARNLQLMLLSPSERPARDVASRATGKGQ